MTGSRQQRGGGSDFEVVVDRVAQNDPQLGAVGEIGTSYLQEYGAAAEVAYQGRLPLRACAVLRPGQRSTVSAILQELALAEESLYAQQLAELLDQPERPPVADLRVWLRQYDGTVFDQVRRGGFVLGSHCQLPG